MGLRGIGKAIESFNIADTNKLSKDYYDKLEGGLLSEKYVNPLDLVSNKSLLTQAERRLNKNEEKIENAAAAGGATVENVLAAKQAGNEAMADLESGVLQGEQARQDNIKNQLLNLESQRVAQQIAAKQQSGQNWAGLTGGLADSLSTLGGTMLENNIPLKDLFKLR